jgi:centractin
VCELTSPKQISRFALNLYGSGKTTGVVLDSGTWSTRAVALFDGLSLPYTFVCEPYGGSHVSRRLGQLLAQETGHAPPALPVLDRIKAELPRVLPSDDDDGSVSNFTLPDGSQIAVSETVQHQVGASLFDPTLLPLGEETDDQGRDEPAVRGVCDLLDACIGKIDRDLRHDHDMYSQIVLAGGNTLFRSFPATLTQRLTAWKPMCRVRVCAAVDADVAWRGGSILASLAVFRDSWVSAEAYAEEGPTSLRDCSG